MHVQCVDVLDAVVFAASLAFHMSIYVVLTRVASVPFVHSPTHTHCAAD